MQLAIAGVITSLFVATTASRDNAWQNIPLNFAQAGSTGGIIGKQDKSVSGGENLESQHQPKKESNGRTERRRDSASHKEPREEKAKPANDTKGRPADRCGNIEGVWAWHSNYLKFDVAFKSSGGGSATNGLTATWSCTNGLFLISWNGGLTDHMVLSSDGKLLSGTSWAGNPISASRK